MKLIFSLALFVAASSDCANILGVFPTPSISHQVVFHALMKDLAARGHQLTILTTDLMKIDNPNVTQIDLHSTYEIYRSKFNFVEFKESKLTELDLIKACYALQLDYYEHQLSHPEVKKLILNGDKKKYDLVIFEHLNYLAFLGFAEHFDCPAIGFASVDPMSIVHEWIGNEANPAIHPELFFSYEHGKLTFAERWNSLKYHFSLKYFVDPEQSRQVEKIVKKHFPSVKSSIEQLRQRIQLLMANTHPAMGINRPILPNTIQLGFMHIEPPKSLPESDLKTFLDNSKNGVIYMSLGSNVQSKDLNPEVLQVFLTVFGSLRYNVLWKFEADHLPNKPKNVMISKWLPQSDLLAHPAIKLFITQGGQQSMEEAIDRAIPMIIIPFLADQDANAQRLKQRDVGHRLQLHLLTNEALSRAITKMLKPIYKENIQNLRDLIYDEPMTSREKAVWWTEYVIRHKGSKHLEYSGRLVPFYQKYWLDFIGIALFSIVLALKLLSFVTRKLFFTKKHKQE